MLFFAWCQRRQRQMLPRFPVQRLGESLKAFEYPRATLADITSYDDFLYQHINQTLTIHQTVRKRLPISW